MNKWIGIKKDDKGSYMAWIRVGKKILMISKSWYTDKYYIGILTAPNR